MIFLDKLFTYNVDRCVLTWKDALITLVILLVLLALDYYFTVKNLKLMKELMPEKKFNKLLNKSEFNIIFKVLVKIFGFNNKAIIIQGFVSLFLLLLVLFMFPFAMPVLIGFLLCMDLFIHLPNYKDLMEQKNKIKRKPVIRK